MEGDFDAGVKYCKEECITVAHKSLYGLLQLHVYVGGCIDFCMTPNFTIEKANNIHLATTRLFPYPQGARTTTYTDAADLKSALLASCAAFPAAQMVWRDGSYHIDGGLTDFQPVIDENTITVSPFYFSDCDIKPSRYVPIWWAFLPPNANETCDWLYGLGFEDGMRYIERRQILQHIRRKETAPGTAALTDTTATTADNSTTTDSTDNTNQTNNRSVASAEGSTITAQNLHAHNQQQTHSQRSGSSTLKAFLKDISQVCRRGRKQEEAHPYDTPRRVRSVPICCTLCVCVVG